MTAAPATGSRTGQIALRRQACLASRTDTRARMLVLAVESDADIADGLQTGLANHRIDVVTCADPAEALLLLGRLCPDAVVLGEALGRVEPLAFLEIARRQEPELPIVVGANSQTSDFAAQAQVSGAAVVLVRPYDLRKLLQVFRPDTFRPEPIDLGRLRIDAAVPRMWLDGDEVLLPPREFTLLRCLARRVDTVVSRDELLDAAWGHHDRDADNSLSVHILRLRRRFGDTHRAPQWIKAVRGMGYRLCIPPQADPRSSFVHHV